MVTVGAMRERFFVLVSEEIEYREETPAEVTEVGVTAEKM